MSEKTRILDVLDRAYRADAWCGPSLLESVAGLRPADVARRPVKGGHTIWELVEHVASWNEIVATRLTAEPPIVTAGMNFPPMPRPTPAAWAKTLRRLARSQAKFRAAVKAFPVAKLGRKRPRVAQTWSVLIHGQIEHQLYHAGQIALLRRAVGRPIGG